MSNYIVSDTDLTSVANAIRTKSGSNSQLSFPTEFVTSIENISVPQFDEDADFCFWDYDGTPLYSFSKAEIQTMTQLPSPPDHSIDDIPLSFLGWNWSLEDLKALNCPMDIGAYYRPTDGKMHWTYRLTSATGLTCSFTISGNSVIINWGDGTEELWGSSTDNGTSATHTYAAPGDYHCTWYGEGRPTTKLRTEDNKCVIGKFVVGDNMTGYWLSSYWKNTLDDARIETFVTNCAVSGKTSMSLPATTGCTLLKAFVFPPYFVGRDSNLKNCYNLKRVCLSKTLDEVGTINEGRDYCCSNSTQLDRIRFSPNMGKIVYQRFTFSNSQIKFFNGYALTYKCLENCRTLERLVIKSTIDSTALGANCVNIKEIWCGLTTPPTLSASTPFSGLLPYAKIHVPASALQDYQEASNWSVYADRIVGDWTEDPVK